MLQNWRELCLEDKLTRDGELHWRSTGEGEAADQATGEVRVRTTPVLVPCILQKHTQVSVMSAQDPGEDGRKINSWACVKCGSRFLAKQNVVAGQVLTWSKRQLGIDGTTWETLGYCQATIGHWMES
jgi:hypothetical protein